MIAANLDFDGASLVASLQATLERRGTSPDPRVLDDMRHVLAGRRWQSDWAAMRREKAVVGNIELVDAVARFDSFVRPMLVAVSTSVDLGHWVPGGPWPGSPEGI